MKLIKVKCKDVDTQQAEIFKKEFENFKFMGNKLHWYGYESWNGTAEFGKGYEQEVQCESSQPVFSKPDKREAEFCFFKIILNKDGTMDLKVTVRDNLKHWIWRKEPNRDRDYTQRFKYGDYNGVKNSLKQLESEARKWTKELRKEEKKFLESVKPTQKENDFNKFKGLRLCGQLPFALARHSWTWDLLAKKSDREVTVYVDINPYDGSIIVRQGAGGDMTGYLKTIAQFGPEQPIEEAINFLKKKYDNSRYTA